jgi:hypothetical protein
MTVKGVFLDFGFVIGYQTPGINRKYFYLDWDGIDTMLKDPDLTQHLRLGVGQAELEAFFDREIYRVFVAHEQTDATRARVCRLVNGCSIVKRLR